MLMVVKSNVRWLRDILNFCAVGCRPTIWPRPWGTFHVTRFRLVAVYDLVMTCYHEEKSTQRQES